MASSANCWALALLSLLSRDDRIQRQRSFLRFARFGTVPAVTLACPRTNGGRFRETDNDLKFRFDSADHHFSSGRAGDQHPLHLRRGRTDHSAHLSERLNAHLRRLTHRRLDESPNLSRSTQRAAFPSAASRSCLLRMCRGAAACPRSWVLSRPGSASVNLPYPSSSDQEP